MRFLLKTLLITGGVAAALLFWWRPAQELLSIEPVDWAAAYEKRHTSAGKTGGIMGMGSEMIRSAHPHRPLTEFIHEKTKDHLIRVSSEAWGTWVSTHITRDGKNHTDPIYFPANTPLLSELAQPDGYIEVSRENRIDFLRYVRLGASDLGDRGIPETLHYPYRTPAMAIFAASLAVAVLSRFGKKKENPVAQSSACKGCKVFVAIWVSGTGLIILPFLYGIHNEAPPYVFTGGFIFICGLIGLAMFGSQVSMVEKMTRGKDRLAHWTYTPAEWKRYAELEFKTQRSEKRGLLLFISAIILLVGAGFWVLAGDEAAGWVFVFLMGFTMLLWLMVLIIPRLSHRKNMRKTGEVYMGPSGVYINGTVHSWAFPGSRFDAAEYSATPLPLLSLTYSYLMTAGRSLYFFRQAATVRVPVPRGKEAEAKKIVFRYKKLI